MANAMSSSNEMTSIPLKEKKEDNNNNDNIFDLHKSHGYKLVDNKLTTIRHSNNNEPQPDCPVNYIDIHPYILKIKLN